MTTNKKALLAGAGAAGIMLGLMIKGTFNPVPNPTNGTYRVFITNPPTWIFLDTNYSEEKFNEWAAANMGPKIVTNNTIIGTNKAYGPLKARHVRKAP